MQQARRAQRATVVVGRRADGRRFGPFALEDQPDFLGRFQSSGAAKSWFVKAPFFLVGGDGAEQGESQGESQDKRSGGGERRGGGSGSGTRRGRRMRGDAAEHAAERPVYLCARGHQQHDLQEIMVAIKK